jgi:hypothetical protein
MNTDVEDRLHEVVAHEAESHRQRSGVLVAAAAVVVVGVGFGALLLISAGGDQAPVGSADPMPTVSAPEPAVVAVPPPTLPNGDPWPLPRLALDMDQLGLQLTLMSAYSEFTPADTGMAGTWRPYLQVLRRGQDTFEPPMIWIETNDSGSDYLRSGVAQEESGQEFTINGTVFFLLEDGDRALVTAELPSGASVYITGLGVEADDLVAFVSGLSEAAPEPGWDMPEPPLRMQIVFEGHLPGIYDSPGYASQIVGWGNSALVDSEGTGVELYVESRGEVSFERRLYEVAGGATDQTLVRSGTVRGRPAAVIGLSDVQVVVWRDTDEATTLLSVRSTALPLERFIAALVEVDEATWQAMEERMVDSVEPVPTTTSIPPVVPDGEAGG